MKIENIKKGLEIIEACLDNCSKLQFSVNIFQPSQDIMDMLLAKDYLKVRLNCNEPDSDILRFHDSEDKYPHNGNIDFVCYLSQVPEVLQKVRKHKKIIALIKEMKKREEK